MRYRNFLKRGFCTKRLLEKVSLYPHFRNINRGSFVVEAAGVLPVFLLGILAMVSLMDVWAMNTRHLMSACESAKEQGIAAWSSEGASEVTGTESWVYHPIGGILPLPSVGMHTEIRVHAWNGADWTGIEEIAGEPEEMVYVALHGSVYHTESSCSYLNPGAYSVSGSAVDGLRNDSGGRYYPCETCSWHQSPGSVVYITSSGSSYHNLGSCSRIEHTYSLVPISQVSGMHLCSRCGRMHG